MSQVINAARGIAVDPQTGCPGYADDKTSIPKGSSTDINPWSTPRCFALARSLQPGWATLISWLWNGAFASSKTPPHTDTAWLLYGESSPAYLEIYNERTLKWVKATAGFGPRGRPVTCASSSRLVLGIIAAQQSPFLQHFPHGSVHLAIDESLDPTLLRAG